MEEAEPVGYDYSPDVFKIYREFVYKCVSYNTRTATNILVHHKCRLFSAGKIRMLVDEFMKARELIEVPIQTTVHTQIPTSVQTQMPSTAQQFSNVIMPCSRNRALILLQIIERLPSYARIGGGMVICALARYLTPVQWNEQLDYVESSQNTAILWTEQFINACIVIIECDDDAAINRFIETEAEKIPLRLSCMRRSEYVDLTFVD